MAKLLDLDELNQITKPYARSKNLDTYNYLLEQCHKKIKEFNRINRSKFCYYKPPLHMINRAMYNYFDLVAYLMEQLQNNGLHCQYVKSEGIFICWDPNVLNMTNYQNELTYRQDIQQITDNTTAVKRNDPPRPKSRPKSNYPKPNYPKPNYPKKGESKMVDILKIEGDTFPVNIDGFKF